LFLLSLGLHTENHGQIFINVICVNPRNPRLTITKKQSFFNTCRLIEKTIHILFQCQLLNETAKRFDLSPSTPRHHSAQAGPPYKWRVNLYYYHARYYNTPSAYKSIYLSASGGSADFGLFSVSKIAGCLSNER
jgi:hypothetical protein